MSCVSGGLDSRGQEAMLRKQPDIIIATPGRLVDHLHNAPSFNLNTVEILVLDEADRCECNTAFCNIASLKTFTPYVMENGNENIFVDNFKGRNHLSAPKRFSGNYNVYRRIF